MFEFDVVPQREEIMKYQINNSSHSAWGSNRASVEQKQRVTATVVSSAVEGYGGETAFFRYASGGTEKTMKRVTYPVRAGTNKNKKKMNYRCVKRILRDSTEGTMGNANANWDKMAQDKISEHFHPQPQQTISRGDMGQTYLTYQSVSLLLFN
jgi:hypothetical protein